MIRKFWDFLASIELTFYLIIAAIIFFLISASYNSLNFAFFLPMNEMMLQDWIGTYLFDRPDVTWWLPPLLGILTLLGINTAVCTIKRVNVIWQSRKSLDGKTFFHRLTPSLIHCFFLVIMTGHLVTFTAGSWQRIPLKKGGTVSIDTTLPPLKIDSISHEFYPPESALDRRISGTSLSIHGDSGKKFKLSYLSPVSYGRYHILLDMIKVRKKDMVDKKSAGKKIFFQDQNNCNKADLYHMIEQEENKKLTLLIISDPGLPVIITGFTGILILMIWYFIVLYKTRTQP
jgi:hypothetical protein